MDDRRFRFGWIIVLSLVSSIGPLASDTYLAGLPELTAQYGASDAEGQLTISACIIGLALGQLAFGPLSDRIGRRGPLMGGLAAFTVLSFACVFAPTIWTLIVLRFLHGFAASSGLALSRAMVRDVYGEDRAAKVFAQLMTIAVIVPVMAPILGGALLLVTDWRGIFVAVGAVSVVIAAVAWFALPETLPADRRHAPGSGQFRAIVGVLRDGRFLGYLGVIASGSVIMFGFISMSVLAYHNDFDVDPQQFAIVFGVNTAAIALVSQVNLQLMRWFRPGAVLAVGIAAAAVAGWIGLVGAIAGFGFWWVLVFTLLAVSSLGVISPNASALAIGPHQANAGAASALVGVAQFGAGAIIAPVVTATVGANAISLTAMLAVAGTFGFCFVMAAGVAGSRLRPIEVAVR